MLKGKFFSRQQLQHVSLWSFEVVWRPAAGFFHLTPNHMTAKKKTIQVRGFGQKFKEEDDVPELTPEPEFSFEEQLVAIILNRYKPAEEVADATEQKSSTDLIDEMESVIEPEKNKLYLAMKDAGFQLHYNGEAFVWLLKERTQ